MAEIGTLGDIVFKVSANKVRTFDDLKIDSKTNYAKHTRHLKKPLLEFQYNDADTASLTIYLSAFLGVKEKSLRLLSAVRNTAANGLSQGIQKIMRNSTIKETF